jgi:hypothetical protein
VCLVGTAPVQGEAPNGVVHPSPTPSRGAPWLLLQDVARALHLRVLTAQGGTLGHGAAVVEVEPEAGAAMGVPSGSGVAG